MKHLAILVLTSLSITAFSQSPSITTFSPASGQSGSVVTITGTGFSTVTTENHVYFGTAKTSVSAASTTQLTVTVPSGATQASISVTVAGRTGWSALPFHITFPTNGVVDVNSFSAYTDLNTDADPQDVAFGDFDGDGKTDLAVVNSTANTVKVYRNESTVGNPVFTNVVSFTTAATPIKVHIHDLDGDGKLDIAALCTNAVSILRNTHTSGAFTAGSFAPKADLPTVGGTTFINPLLAIADMDGDGRADIVTGNSNSSVLVYQNATAPGTITPPSFQLNATLTVFDDPTGLAVADVDVDGKQDIIAAVRNGNRISVFRNVAAAGPLSAASFMTLVDFTLTQPLTLTAGDLDGDGKPDLAARRNDDGHIYLFRNTSSPGVISPGSLSAALDLGAPGTPLDIHMTDVDGDGGTDVIVSSQFGPLTVYHNTKNGTINGSTFTAGVDFASPDYMYGLEMGDLDGDGRPDVAVAKNFNVNLLAVALNNTAYSVPPPVITGFAPASGPVGTTVAISGTGFSSTAASNIVYFGATRATVTNATATQLTVTSPHGATYQPISVTVAGLTMTTKTPFTTTFPNGTINASAFAGKVDFFLNNTAAKVAIGDLDGDGKSDLAALNGPQMSVFINTSTTGTITATSFNTRFDFSTTHSNPSSIAIADVDGDGKKDVVTSDFSPSRVSIFRNIVAGTFSASSLASRVDLNVSGNARDVIVTDLDGDGKPDLAVADGSTIALFRNRCTPGNILPSLFEARVNLPGAVPVALTSQDLDADNRPEIIAVGNQLTVYKNLSVLGSLSVLSFAASVTFPASTTARGVAVGDFDGDGKPDVAVTLNATDQLAVFHNSTTAGVINTSSLAAPVLFTTGDGPSAISVADFDGDGKADIVVTNDGPRSVSLFENNSTAGSISASSFTPKVDFSSGHIASVAAGDLDNDFKPELVIANFASSIAVLRNTVAPLPVIIATSNNVAVCDAATANLVVAASGTTNLSYQWQKFNGSVYADIVNGGAYTGTTTATLSVSTTGNFGAGNYRCRVSGDQALTVYANTTLTVNPVPAAVSIAVTGSTTICPSGSVILTAPAGYSSYDWSNGAATSSITVTAAGSYTVQVSNITGCESPSSTPVVVTAAAAPAQPTITAPSTVLCAAGGIVVSAPVGFQSYLWSNGEVSREILVTTAGSYAVRVTNTSGCVSVDSAPVVIMTASIPAPPVIAVTGNTEICSGDTVTLTAPAGFPSYTWSNGATTQSIIVTFPGSYTVVVAGDGGCSSPASTPVVVTAATDCNTVDPTNNPPVIAPAKFSVAIRATDSFPLAGLISDADGNVDLGTLEIVAGQSGVGDPSIGPGNTLVVDYRNANFVGTDHITVRVCDDNAACTQQQMEVDVVGKVVVHNGVTPDGDGFNDVFLIEYVDVIPGAQDNKVTIYNRWGDVVFEAEDYDNSGNVFAGISLNGSDLPSGNYFYKVEINGGETLTGYLTLRR